MHLIISVLLSTLLVVNSSLAQNISTECLEDSSLLVSAALEGQLWALHMLDASTKIPDGIFYGNIDQLGNYEECVQAKGPGFHGQYCRAVVLVADIPSFPQSKSQLSHNWGDIHGVTHNDMFHKTPREGQLLLRAAFCTPSSCSPTDVQLLIQEYGPFILSSITGGDPPLVLALADPLFCTDEATKAEPLGLVGWMLTAVLLLLVAVILAATAVDSWKSSRYNKPEAVSSFLLAVLSARHTTIQLISMRPEPMGCLHGLRVLSMAWIILGHCFEIFMYTPNSNINSVVDGFLRVPINMTILNAFMAVDTFFFLSGLLLFYVFNREMKTKGKFHVINFYLFRYLRLTLPLLVMVLFYIFFVIHFGDGPSWESTIRTAFFNFCNKNWWTTILYVNNYVFQHEACGGQTWYLSVDMQLALLSPLVLLPLYYAPNAGLQLMALLTAISCFIPFTITYLNNYPWSSVIVEQDYFDIMTWLREIYLPTHARASPYLVGILVGYYLSNYHDKALKMSKHTVIAGWLMCTASCLTIIYTLAIPYQKNYEYEPVSAAFYAGFHRFGWSLGMAWIVITCVKGYGGPVNTFLAWPGFQPFSKITYAAYITHIAISYGYVASFQTTSFYSSYEIVRSYFGDLPIIIIASVLLHVFVEAPTVTLIRTLLRGNNSKKKIQKRTGED